MIEQKRSLPKLNSPIFELILPSTGEKIRYRQFTVKEEKILLTAQETKDIEQAILSIKQVVNNCLIDKKIEDLAMFDLEYVLLTLRSKSVDNNVEFTIKDPDTEEPVKIELDLNDVKVIHAEGHDQKIKVDDTYTLFMRYPTIDEFLQLMIDIKAKNSEANFKMMVRCMDKLVSEDEVYKLDEWEEKEILEFIDSFDSSVVKKLKTFFETMPKMRHEIKYTNKNDDEKTFVIEGIETFFI